VICIYPYGTKKARGWVSIWRGVGVWEVEKKEGGGLVVANYTVRGFEKMGGYLCKTQHLADERDS